MLVSTWVVLGASELGRLGRDRDNGVLNVHYVTYDVTGVIGRAANDVIAAHAVMNNLAESCKQF